MCPPVKIVMPIKKVSIIGMGLMGGSLALALRKAFPDFDVWGYARSVESFKRVDKYLPGRVERDLGKLIKDADIVFLSLPVYAIIEYFGKIAPFLKEGTIVCDLASTKAQIEKGAKQYLPKHVKFVGCHPLCGSEKSGVENASPDLYKDAVCVITAKETRKETKIVAGTWEALGMTIKFIGARTHDELMSAFSHLPHAISFSLVRAVDVPAGHVDLLPPSWKSMTRIAQSPAAVWVDIFLSNKKNLLKDIKRFQTALKELAVSVKAGEKDKIEQTIKQANKVWEIH